MAEEKDKSLAERIEGLIVDGQQKVLDRVAEVESNLGRRIGAVEDGQMGLETGQKKIMEKMEAVHASLKNEIKVTGWALTDKIEEAKKEVKEKIEEHARLPHPV